MGVQQSSHPIEISFATKRLENRWAGIIRERADRAYEAVENMLGAFKNRIELQYQFENCGMALTLRDPLEPKYNLLGMRFGPKRFASILVLTSPGYDSVETLAHEFTHVWIGQHGISLPTGIEEGIAQYVASGGKIGSGALHQLRNSRPITKTEMLTLGSFRDLILAGDAGDPIRRSVFATGWAVVHKLMTEDGETLHQIMKRKDFPDPQPIVQALLEKHPPP